MTKISLLSTPSTYDVNIKSQKDKHLKYSTYRFIGLEEVIILLLFFLVK